MRHDPSDLGSLIEIRIIPKERTLKLAPNNDMSETEWEKYYAERKEVETHLEQVQDDPLETEWRAKYSKEITSIGQRATI